MAASNPSPSPLVTRLRQLAERRRVLPVLHNHLKLVQCNWCAATHPATADFRHQAWCPKVVCLEAAEALEQGVAAFRLVQVQRDELQDALLALSHAQETLRAELAIYKPVDLADVGGITVSDHYEEVKEGRTIDSVLDDLAEARALLFAAQKQLALQVTRLDTLRAYMQHQPKCKSRLCCHCGRTRLMHDCDGYCGILGNPITRWNPCDCSCGLDALLNGDRAPAEIPETPEKDSRLSGAEEPTKDGPRSASAQQEECCCGPTRDLRCPIHSLAAITLREWQAEVTCALQREGGAFFADVPQHVRDLVATLAGLRAKIEALEGFTMDDPLHESWAGEEVVAKSDVLKLLTPSAEHAAACALSDVVVAAQAEEQTTDFQRGVLFERERCALLAERTQVGMNSLKGFAATIREGPGESGE